MDTTYRPMSANETLCMDDTWAILARTISQYTVHGAPKFMIFWSISLTQYGHLSALPQNGKRCRAASGTGRSSD